MIEIHEVYDLAECQPKEWYIVFRRKCEVARWVNKLPIGRFKHVLAFGYVEASNSWLFLSVGPFRTDILSVPDYASQRALELAIRDDEVLKMKPLQQGRLPHLPGFWCVPAVAHLLGIRSCALLPDGLWRKCLKNGAVRIGNG